MSFRIVCFMVLFFGANVMFSNAQESVKPEPGKQVLQSIELPASTSTWDYGAEKMKNIGEPRPLDATKIDTVRYWLFLPADYDKQAESDGAPLFLFLHGAGERGDKPEDVEKTKVHGIPKRLDKEPEFAKTFPCVAVSPQCKNNFSWSPAQLMLLLDDIEKNYKIDKSRIYVSGISMGGFGTWMCLNESPTRFAAAAPICGGAKPEWGDKLVDIPIWDFHGNKDGAVAKSFSDNIVESIRKAGGTKIIYTIYDGGGHDVWTRTYENQLLFDWMFSFKKRG